MSFLPGFPTKTATLKRKEVTDSAGTDNWTEIGEIELHMQAMNANILLSPPGSTPITLRKCYTFDTTDIFEGDILVFTSGDKEVAWTITAVKPYDGIEHHKRLDLEGPHFYEPD